MKITRRQLRRIIREAVISGGADEQNMAEISLSVKYVAVYAMQLSSWISFITDSRKPEIEQLYTLHPLIKPLTVKADMIASDLLKRMDDYGDVSGYIPKSEYSAVEAEAKRDANNFEETLMQKIDVLESYLYDQTPIGMSYVEAMNAFLTSADPANQYVTEDRGTADNIMQWFEDNGEWLQRLSDGDPSIAHKWNHRGHPDYRPA